MSDLTDRLQKVEQYLLDVANGEITAPEALHAECCYRIRKRIKELEAENKLSIVAMTRAGDIVDTQKARIEELEAGIEAIAPWLSASLTEHEHDGKGEYLKACNEIFRLD